MKWLLGLIAVALLLVGGFYAFNSYIYEEKQADLMPAPTDGEHFGFIRAVVDNQTAMDFDGAVWLSGTAGEEAAIRAGLCTPETRSECLPNDFYIENISTETRRFTLSPETRVFMQTWGMEESGEVATREVPLAQFAELINTPELHWQSLPYMVTVTEGVALFIEEIYIP